MSAPHHSCIRCGTPVHDPGAACRDCRASDPALIRAWTKKGTL